MPVQAGAIVLASDSAAVIQHQKQEHESGYNVQLSLDACFMRLTPSV